MYIIVIGGGKVGSNITKMLLASDHEVTLVERDRGEYEEIFEELGEKVILGDGSDLAVLKQAGANRADFVLALTGDDEANLIICQLVKTSFIGPKTLARINDPQNEMIMSAHGVDIPVNLVREINHLISEEVGAGGITPLHIFRDGKTQLVEIEISAKSPLVGKNLSALKLESPSTVVALGRGGEILNPRQDPVVEEEDFLIVLTTKEAEGELREREGIGKQKRKEK